MLKNTVRQLQDVPSGMRIAELGFLKKATHVYATMMLTLILATNTEQQLIMRC